MMRFVILSILVIAQSAIASTPVVKSESRKFQCEMYDRTGRAFQLDGMLMQLSDPKKALSGAKLGEGFVASNSIKVHPGKYEVFYEGVSEFSLFAEDQDETSHMVRLELPAQKGAYGSAILTSRKGATGGWKYDTTGVGFCSWELFLEFEANNK